MLEVYLTDLQAYNEGNLVGKWVKLPISKFELVQAISEVLSQGEAVCGSENHEEFFITDYEWDEYKFHDIDEYENIYELNEQMQLLEFKLDYELKAISFLLSENIAVNIEDAISKVDDVRVYENMNMEDVAYDLMQECYNADTLPSIISNHIDYEGIARDLSYDGCYYELGSDVFEYVG